MRHIFLSPHMDDAVLSAGSFLETLVKQKEHVMVITVFTVFGKRPISWNAQGYLLEGGSLRIIPFTKKRKQEDDHAMHLLSIPYMHLDIVDGAFRKDDNNTIIYPVFTKLFSGNLHPYDQITINTVLHALLPLIDPHDIVYAPLGVGNHADHLIVHHVATLLHNTQFFWLDQPYAWKSGHTPLGGYTEAFHISHTKQKTKAIQCYASQVKKLFPKGIIPKNKEIFYTKDILDK